MSAQTDRDMAAYYIRFWYNASQVSVPVSANYVDFPTLMSMYIFQQLADLGATLRTIRTDKIRAAFEGMAKNKPFAIPRIQDYYGAVSAAVSNITLTDTAEIVADAVEETANDAMTIGGIALGGYAIFLAIGGVILILPYLMRQRA